MKNAINHILWAVGIIVCSMAVSFAVVSLAHADVTNFDDHMGNGGYVTPWMVNGILIDFDQDGSACGGTATDYNIFVNGGSVGSETDSYLTVQGTSTLTATHEQHTVQVPDAFANGMPISSYFNLQMDYSVGGVVCARESSVGFGAQNWRFTSGTNAGWTRNSPGTAHDGVSYADGTAFDVLMDVPNADPGMYPYLATDYQVIGGGFCFPEQAIGSDTTYNSTLPSGDYANLAIVFATDASVDGAGCLTSPLGFIWPVANDPDYFDSFIVGSPIMPSGPGGDTQAMYYYGVTLYWPSIIVSTAMVGLLFGLFLRFRPK